MQYSQSPPPAEQGRTAAEPQDLDSVSDQHVGIRRVMPSVHSPHSSRPRSNQFASDRPSAGRRFFRTLTRFLTAVLIGIGGTLAWQSHGDTAREMVAVQAPTLAWLLSISRTTKAQAVAAVPAASADPMLQLGPLTSNLDVVRRGIEQLAAKQDQIVQNIATLQRVQEDVRQSQDDIRQKMSSAPSPPPQPATPISQTKPPQPKAQPTAVQSLAPRPVPVAG